MGRVISFSDFPTYFEKHLKPSSPFLGTILDTNILVTLTYDVAESIEEITNFLGNEIYDRGFSYFTSVTTKQEFLDFHRRLIMTENLRDAVDEHSQIKLTNAARSEIRKQDAALKQREKNSGHFPVFRDNDLKQIKKAFSAGRHSGFNGWLDYCEAWLNSKLEEMSTRLDDLGIKYLSPKNTIRTEGS